MARKWTDEQKARQAALIHSWKPWTRSTGARTVAGKAVCSKNALVGSANRQAALVLARAKLKAAQKKVTELTRGKELSWFDRLIRESFPATKR